MVSNIQELKDKLPEAVQKCLAFFAGCDRSLQGYEGLIAAQQCLPNNEVRDNFASEYSVLNKIWEALSPDTVLGPVREGPTSGCRRCTSRCSRPAATAS